MLGEYGLPGEVTQVRASGEITGEYVGADELDEVREDKQYWAMLKPLLRKDRMLRKYLPQYDEWKAKQ